MVSLSSSHHTLWPPESGSTAFRGFATAASIHPCHHARRHLRLLDILNYKVLGSVMSYWFIKAPSVGASGTIFGLVGLVSVFVIRHNGMVRGGNEDLMQIRQVIAINMTLDLMARGIDNWGHIGGFLGGSAMAWLIGPQWTYEYKTRDGRRFFMDSAPIPLLLRWRNERRRV